MTGTDPVVIVAAKRTPMGHFNGVFKEVSSPRLGGHVIAALMTTVPTLENKIDQVYMGCVLSAGLGQAPARQAALAAGLSTSTPCTTINKMCGSGMKTVMIACSEILANKATALIAGGMENMSRAPFLLSGARFGYRIGTHAVEDHMMLDGLTNAYDDRASMGLIAEMCAAEFHFTREEQDAFAIESCKRALHAAENGLFNDEITSVTIGGKIISNDEGIQKINFEKITQLTPSFKKEGTITAANSSSISDGAAALLLMRASTAEKIGQKPLASIIADHSIAQEPEWFTTAPIIAIQQLLDKIGWKVSEVDLFEINEAFAVVTMATMNALGIPHEKVNVNGGACILGHPIGASGARILVTLIHALKQRNKKRGVAAICIGGGEATAIAIEV